MMEDLNFGDDLKHEQRPVHNSTIMTTQQPSMVHSSHDSDHSLMGYRSEYHGAGSSGSGVSTANLPIRYQLTVADVAPNLLHMALQAHQSGFYETAEGLAQHYRQQKPDDTTVLMLLSTINFQKGLLAQSAEYCRIVLALDPNLAEPYFQLGHIFKMWGKVELAIAHYERAVHVKPNFIEGLSTLANTLVQNGRHVDAVPYFISILNLNPELLHVRNELGNTFFALGNLEQAKECYAKCLEIEPSFKDAWNNLGCVHQTRNELWLAIHHFEKAVNLDDYFLAAHQNLGNVYRAMKILDKASVQYKRALEVAASLSQSAPGIMFNQGSVFQQQGHVDLALEIFQNALPLMQPEPRIYNCMADCFRVKGEFEKAEQYFRMALAIDPTHTATLNDLGRMKESQGLLKEAVELFERAVKVDRTYISGHWNLANALQKMGFPAAATESYLAIINLEPVTIPQPLFKEDFSCGSFASYMWCKQQIGGYQVDFEEIWNVVLVKMMEWQYEANVTISVYPFHSLTYPVLKPHHCKNIATRHAQELMRKKYLKGKPENYIHSFAQSTISSTNSFLRIGYVSARFGNTPLGRLMYYLVQCHKTDNVGVFCYALNADDGSPFGISGTRYFGDFSSENVKENVAQRIYQDNIQVLVNLDGYINHTVMDIFALKPAPVQVLSSFGYPGTSGGAFMDYLLTDQIAVPVEMAEEFTERLAYVSDTSCFVGCHQYIAPNITPLTIESSVIKKQPEDKDTIVYCNLDHWYKIDTPTFFLWTKILNRVPGSVLWLQRHSDALDGELAFLNRAVSLGLSADTIRFLDQIPSHETQISLCQAAHVYLDTLHFNGNETILDAIWAGVPVVTGAFANSLAGRVSVSQMSSLGITELIADSEDAYVDLAVKLGTDQEYRKQIARKVWNARKESRLFDLEEYTGKLEASFFEMWTRYLKSL